MLVHLERFGEPRGVGAHHVQAQPVDLEAIAATRRMPGRARRFHRRQELEVQRPPQRLTRLQDQPWRKHPEHRRDAAQVVRVAVRRDHEREPRSAVPPQVRNHHAAAGVAHRRPGAAIDQNPAARGGPQQGGVPLPHVEEMYLNATAIVERRGAGERGPEHQRREKSGPRR